MKILSFEQEFTKKTPDRVQILRFMREAIGVKEVRWKDLTTLNLSKVRKHIASKVSGNSPCTYMAILKAFLADYKDEGIIPCKDPNKELWARRVPSQHIALTEEEIMLFDRYMPINDCEADVKILFMRGCLTGARSSDCKTFTTDIISGDTVSYVSEKTKTEVVLPIHRLLLKYLHQQPSKNHDRAVVNRTLKKICERIGFTDETRLYVNGKWKEGPMYKFITMHTSRRTFVSCLALRDVPIGVISKLAGHSTTNMTDRYICINARKPDENAMAFFK